MSLSSPASVDLLCGNVCVISFGYMKSIAVSFVSSLSSKYICQECLVDVLPCPHLLLDHRNISSPSFRCRYLILNQRICLFSGNLL